MSTSLLLSTSLFAGVFYAGGSVEVTGSIIPNTVLTYNDDSTGIQFGVSIGIVLSESTSIDLRLTIGYGTKHLDSYKEELTLEYLFTKHAGLFTGYRRLDFDTITQGANVHLTLDGVIAGLLFKL